MRPPPPDPAAWAAVRALFDQASELPAAARPAALAASGQARAVQDEVRSLLAQADAAAADGLLDQPAGLSPGRLVPEAAEPAATLASGQRLGPWLIADRLGQGGMGEVWAAQRADGAYASRVAIKVLRQGLDSRRVLARFALEQQLLARLDHPHIARLLDAGRTADGQPYFVMEAVTGEPIARACAGRSLAQRLALFLQLADAVAHAHRQLLVHRDLKPSNVLVTADGQVKLLDFGIAKALDPLDGHDGQTTVAGERPFTPHFASPEQVRGEPVGTGTDIYSLGVLLYLMLTGVRPYGRNATSAQDAARSVLQDSPSRPSALAPGPAGDAGWLADRKRLAGDLDNILLKALDKQVAGRYPTVDAFAADIQAYLGGLPVSARPLGWAQRSIKFVARRRLPVALAALGGIALLGGLATALWQKHEADLARQVAERRFAQVRQLAGSMVFRYHDQIAQLPGALATREALLADAVRWLDGLLAEGSPDPALAREVAETYQRIAVLQGEQFSPSLERLADARRNLDKALALQPRYLAGSQVAAEALLQGADMWLARASQAGRAARLAEHGLALQSARGLVERALLGRPDDVQALSRLATLEGHLGMALGGSASSANLGRVDEALGHLQAAVGRFEQLYQRQPGNAEWAHQLAWGCQNLSHALLLAGRAADALPWAQRTVALRDEALRLQTGNAQFQYQPATARMLLATEQSALGAHAAGLALQDEVDAIVRRTIAADPANKAALRDLGFLALARGRALVAAGLAADALPLLQALVDGQPANGADFYLARLVSEARVWLARAKRVSDPAAALAHARAAQPAMRGDDDNAARRWALAQALGEEALALQALGQTPAAAEVARRAWAVWRASVPVGAQPPGLFAPWIAPLRGLADA